MTTSVGKAELVEAVAAIVRDQAWSAVDEAGNLSVVLNDLGPRKSERYNAAMALVFSKLKKAHDETKAALSQLRKSVRSAQELRGDDLKGVVDGG